MIKKGLGYVIGEGRTFFGEPYNIALNSVNLSNHEDLNYIVYYSIGTVANTKKSVPLSYHLALKEKERILNETEDLVQLWLYSDNIVNKQLGSVINSKLKQTYKDYNSEFNLGGFRLALYNQDCFIENHDDGIDENRTFVIIFYLSKDWKSGMGGELVITTVDGEEIIVEPKFGNFVIFDFKQTNLQHKVNKVTDDSFKRLSLIDFVFDKNYDK